MTLGSDARGVIAGAIRGAAADAGDCARALLEAFWYRRAIFDPPQGNVSLWRIRSWWTVHVTTRLCSWGVRDCMACSFDSWPRLRLFLPVRKARR
jgi:hypothetical protein